MHLIEKQSSKPRPLGVVRVQRLCRLNGPFGTPMAMIPPKVSVSEYVGMIKSRTAIRVFNKFRELNPIPPALRVDSFVSILRAQSRVGSSTEDKEAGAAVVSDPFTIVTGSPTRVDTKSRRAVPRGTRMHPWEAGWRGTTPS